jgi:hypothetical protein
MRMDTTLSLKEQAYEVILKQLRECTVENSTTSAVVITVDSNASTVKVYGLNLMEEEVPDILIEAALYVQEQQRQIIKNRILN